MNSSEGVKALSRFVEWLLSFYQSAVNSLIEMLTGGHTDSALTWLMKSWKSLFILIVIAGTALNITVYFVRWKPHWWWFAKRRMVVDDALLARRKPAKSASPARRKPSTIVPRKDSAQSLQLSTKAPSPLFKDDADSLFDDPGDELMEVHTKKRKS
ncbi:MAG: hypothetical protein IJU28_04380 [Clostridia bacterium]|nr:hypothetical protein [Clostridia bacterium]